MNVILSLKFIKALLSTNDIFPFSKISCSIRRSPHTPEDNAPSAFEDSTVNLTKK